MSDATPAAPAAPEAPATAPDAPETPAASADVAPTEPPRDDKGRFLTRAERVAAAKAAADKPEAPPAEAKPPEPPKPPEEAKKPDPMAAKVAELARREREAQKAAAAAKEREAKLAEREAKLQEWEGFLGKAKEDPDAAFKVLERAGLSYEQLTALVLDGKAPKPEDKVAAAVKAAEEKVAALEKRLAEKEAAEAAARNKADADAYFAAGEAEVRATPEKFALVLKHEAGLDTVRALIIEHAKATGEVLTFTEAAAKAEAELRQEAQKWLGFAPLLSGQVTGGSVAGTGGGSTPPESAAPQAVSETGPKTTPRTLSNSQATAAPPKPQPSLANLSRADRVARAKELLAKGQG